MSVGAVGGFVFEPFRCWISLDWTIWFPAVPLCGLEVLSHFYFCARSDAVGPCGLSAFHPVLTLVTTHPASLLLFPSFHIANSICLLTYTAGIMLDDFTLLSLI